MITVFRVLICAAVLPLLLPPLAKLLSQRASSARQPMLFGLWAMTEVASRRQISSLGNLFEPDSLGGPGLKSEVMREQLGETMHTFDVCSVQLAVRSFSRPHAAIAASHAGWKRPTCAVALIWLTLFFFSLFGLVLFKILTLFWGCFALWLLDLAWMSPLFRIKMQQLVGVSAQKGGRSIASCFSPFVSLWHTRLYCISTKQPCRDEMWPHSLLVLKSSSTNCEMQLIPIGQIF